MNSVQHKSATELRKNEKILLIGLWRRNNNYSNCMWPKKKKQIEMVCIEH